MASRDADHPALWDAYFATRSAAARNAIVEQYLPLVQSILNRVIPRLPGDADVDDLYQAGAMGLMRAVDTFDPARGVKPATYFATIIRGAIADGMRNADYLTRTMRDRYKKYTEARRELRAELAHEPSREELRARLKLTPEKFALVEADVQCVRDHVSIDKLVADDGGDALRLIDITVDHKAVDPAAVVDRKDFVQYIIRILPPKWSFIIVFYFVNGETMKQIAKRVGVSESRTSQKIGEALTWLRPICEMEAA